jgi:hypothetical protein
MHGDFGLCNGISVSVGAWTIQRSNDRDSLWILLYMPLRSRLRNPTLTHYHRHFIGKHNSNKTAKRNYNLAENSRSVTGLVEIWPFVVKDIP